MIDVEAPAAPMAAATAERVTNLCLSLVAFTVLAFAVWLQPSVAGHGTHEQLGLPPCNFLDMTGLPCLSCGMTTAFAHTVRGELLAAFLSQPFGLLLALITIVSVPALLWSAATGRSLAFPIGQLRWNLWGPVLLASLLGAWAFKILQIRAGA